MSRTIHVGDTPEGFPIYGLAPEPLEVPSQFSFGPGGQHDVIISCGRDDCWWQTSVVRSPLTEVVALARGHVEEAHRGQ